MEHVTMQSSELELCELVIDDDIYEGSTSIQRVLEIIYNVIIGIELDLNLRIAYYALAGFYSLKE